jgi:6-phosphogluconate dehydrogenase
LDSYLVEITAAILAKKDEDGQHVVDYILDTAGQKGTGKWTGINALDMGVPVTLVTEAVFGRCLSSQKEDRVLASQLLKGPQVEAFKGDKQQFINDIRDAVYASFLVSCAQCFVLMRTASTEYKWDLNYGGVALMWRGGCIIRSKYLKNIFEAFQANPNLPNLLLDSFFSQKIAQCTVGWRRVVVQSAITGVPTPTISAGLAYFDGLRRASGPANIIQAQRDYFGAHTYERTDKAKGEFFHTNWTGHGGSTSSNAYVV